MSTFVASFSKVLWFDRVIWYNQRTDPKVIHYFTFFAEPFWLICSARDDVHTSKTIFWIFFRIENILFGRVGKIGNTIDSSFSLRIGVSTARRIIGRKNYYMRCRGNSQLFWAGIGRAESSPTIQTFSLVFKEECT